MSRNALGNAQVNQPRFFAPGDDIDAATQASFGNREESVGILEPAECLGANSPHVRRGYTPQSLTETGEASKGALLGFFIQPTLPIQAASQAHHFLDAVEHPQFTVLAPGNEQMKAVAAEVDSRKGIVALGQSHVCLLDKGSLVIS
jgi:hypothetical protein